MIFNNEKAKFSKSSIKIYNLKNDFSDIEDIKWNEEKSILLFPSYYKERNAGFFPLSEKSFIFF